MDLSLRWFLGAEKEPCPGDAMPRLGEMRMVVRRKEAKLIASGTPEYLTILEGQVSKLRELLKSKDIEVLDEIPDQGSGTVLIRAHGVPPTTKQGLKNADFKKTLSLHSNCDIF